MEEKVPAENMEFLSLIDDIMLDVMLFVPMLSISWPLNLFVSEVLRDGGCDCS